MRPRIEGPQDLEGPVGWGRRSGSARVGVEATAVGELFASWFGEHVKRFLPGTELEPMPAVEAGGSARAFAAESEPTDADAADPHEVRIFGRRFRIARSQEPLGALERRLVGAIGRVMSTQYHGLFRMFDPGRLGLYQGPGEDHFVAAFIEPRAYGLTGSGSSRIATTIQTLRTAALSTYENRRVSTGALLLGGDDGRAGTVLPTPPDALLYGVELTGLKSLHRLCDGKRTLFQVDVAGKLAGVIDVARFAAAVADPTGGSAPPCTRTYQPHARATSVGGHVCLVLSPNQEIKVFAQGVQVFAFAHGRWRLLDVAGKAAVWDRAVQAPGLAGAVFQAALNLAEARHGALFVVVDDPGAAIERLVSPHDLLSEEPADGQGPADLLAKRALHYLARGRNLRELDPPVLEALASLDGAVVADRSGRLLAFGAILRHESSDLPALTSVEGARTTAALVASRYGAVLKVSEDGLVSCFVDGARAWDL